MMLKIDEAEWIDVLGDVGSFWTASDDSVLKGLYANTTHEETYTSVRNFPVL